MTCVACIIKDGIGYMASDSCASQGDHEKTVKNKKVFNANGILMGFCGSWRCINIVQNSLITDDFNLELSVHNFSFKLANRLKDLMEDFNAASKTDDVLEMDCEVLLVYGDNVVKIGHDFSYIILKDTYAAIGSGSDHAEGSIANKTTSPTALLKQAVKISSKHNSGVDDEVVVISNA